MTWRRFAKPQNPRQNYEWIKFFWELVIHWRWAEQNPDADSEDVENGRAAVAEVLGQAVAEKNSAIFRTIADMLDRLPKGNATDIDRLRVLECYDLTPLRFVTKARVALEWEDLDRRWRGMSLTKIAVKVPPKKRLTKREVRLLAQRMWATARLINQGKLYGRSSRLTPEATEELIQAEIGRLPNQDWTELFKEAGCANLPSAQAGRPPKKKKKI